MQLIKLDATDSTNAYLKKLLLSSQPEDFTVVSVYDQKKGRGQMGAVWQSNPGKNLTFSVLKKFENFEVKDRFLLNATVSLALFEVLKKWQIPDLSVKWPNDILSGSFKIGGILIENILQKQNIQASILGIGLNVNQQDFDGLPNVSSLKLISGKELPLDELLLSMLTALEKALTTLEGSVSHKVLQDYEKVLFRKDKPSTFRDQNGALFMGFIRGVSTDGKLVVELEDAVKKTFEMKEIQLLY